jgi:hypothetical protein
MSETPDEAKALRDVWHGLIARHDLDVPAILAGAVAIEKLRARLVTAEARRESLICGMVSLSGPNGEPLACGFRHVHDGEHSWATLPTFIARREQPMSETPDELLARLGQLHDTIVNENRRLVEHDFMDENSQRDRYVAAVVRFQQALRGAWPTIDNLLDRLATAEVERDRWKQVARKIADDAFSDGRGALQHYADAEEALTAEREHP